MIKQYKDYNIFLEICDKLKEVKDGELSEKSLYGYMTAGIYNKKVFTFASHDKGKMNGCLVLTLVEINQIMGLDILFVWLDAHYPKLFKEYIAFIDKKAKEYKTKRIISITKKSVKLIERKYGKYGYKKVYNIFVKEVI